MRRVTQTEVNLSFIKKIADLIERRKCAAIVVFSVLEMLCCTKTFYETFMIPALTMLLLEVSGAFSKKAMEQYKRENIKGFFGTLILIRFMEVVALIVYISTIYSVFLGK